MSKVSYHTKELLKLPLIHKDPFDRMLITQTKYENMVLLSNEILFDSYDIKRFW
jgi:PIN domain nuclease of toxin-antitoxin system